MAALCASCQYLAEPVWSPSAAGADRVLFATVPDTDNSTRAAISNVITARLAAAESLRD